MSLFFSEWHLIFKRTLANWRLLSTLMVGVLVAVALLSSTPLYSNAINDLGLKRALRESQIEMLDMQVLVPSDLVNHQSYQKTAEFIDIQVSRNIRPVVRQEETWIKTQDYYAGWDGRPMPSGEMRPIGYFHTFSNLEKHIAIVEGEYAEPVAAGLSKEVLEDPDFAIEGMIGPEAAELFKVGVGDRLIFLTGYGADERQIKIELTAIIEPVDYTEEFWMLKTDVFAARPEDGEVAPIFISEQTLFEGVAGVIPATRASYYWFYFVDIDRIDSQNAGKVNNDIKSMERQLLTNLPKSGMLTMLNSIIKQYQDKLMYTQIPLFLIVSQIVVIVLYYLVTVSNMLIERQAGEIALFRSRGASTRQITSIYFMQGLLMTAIGAAVGPFLGAFVFSMLGTTASFYSLTGGGLLPVRFSGTVFILAAASAAICLLTILVPAIQAARRGVVHQRQQAARPADKPLWQRFYLDLVILAFGAVLYWELKERGSLLTMDVFGGLNIDPILLITPMLILLAVAIIFLRLFPLFISLLTKIGTYLGNTPALLSLWHMARNPVHYGRLILLLIMAASVGMFSATFLGTLDRSYNERTMYVAGSDVRIEGLYDWISPAEVLRERYSGVPGVEKLSMAHRIEGRVGTMFTETEFTMLSIDVGNAGEIAWYRDDFADKSFSEFMRPLANDEPLEQGLNLPEGTERLGIWVYPEEGNPQLTVVARIRDGLGHYRDNELGTTSQAGWQYLEAKLTTIGTDNLPPPPLKLVCIYVRFEDRSEYWSYPGGIYFDDLQVKGSFSSESMVIEDFEDVTEWTAMSYDGSGSLSSSIMGTDKLTISNEAAYNGDSSLQYSWMHRRGSVRKGIFANLDGRPIAAVASNSFLNSARVSVGDLVNIRIPGEFIPVVIVEAIDYFPTLDPAEKGFMIVNLERFLSPRNTLDSRINTPNEVWLKVTDDEEIRKATLETLNYGQYRGRKLYDREAMLSELKADPLAGAGWEGMLMIAFMGVVLVSGLGFIVYNYLSAQSRQLDFAILRTLGFSLRQIIGMVSFEQLFIIVIGMGIGTLIGERLSYVMLPFLQLTEKGERVLPPFILTINWGTIGIAYAVLFAAFIITISMVILFFYRAAIHQTLRMGDV